MSAWFAVAAFLRRDWQSARSYRLSFLTSMIQPVFTLILLFYLGHLIGKSKLVAISGGAVPYFSFAVLGFALLAIAQAGLQSLTNAMRIEQTSGTIEALLASATPPSVVILASAAYDLLSALVEMVVYLALAILVFGLQTKLSPTALFGAMLAMVFTLMLTASLGVVLAALTILVKRTGPLVALTVSGIGLLGGAYFPIALLPGPLRVLGEVLPFTWAVDLFRDALLRGQWSASRAELLLSISVLAVPSALLIFGAAVKRVRKSGTLSHY